MTKTTSANRSANRAPAVSSIRTSQVLREILTKNPTIKNFSVQRIVNSIGDHRPETSLMFFSIPSVVPVPGTSKLVGLPAGMIAGQMIAGRTKFKLPKFILGRSVPRRSLAVAIHMILPVLERAEKVAKPRWRWASHPAAQRILGIFIFILALAIAFPILGFNVPHAAAILIITFGLVEQDGLAIVIGVVAGMASLVLAMGASVSVRAFRSKVGAWVKKISVKLGLAWAATFLKKMGFQWAMMLLFAFADVLLLWDPEASSRPAKRKKPKKTPVKEKQTGLAVRRSQKPSRLPAFRSQLKAA
jgi:hypothetical protein